VRVAPAVDRRTVGDPLKLFAVGVGERRADHHPQIRRGRDSEAGRDEP